MFKRETGIVLFLALDQREDRRDLRRRLAGGSGEGQQGLGPGAGNAGFLHARQGVEGGAGIPVVDRVPALL